MSSKRKLTTFGLGWLHKADRAAYSLYAACVACDEHGEPGQHEQIQRVITEAQREKIREAYNQERIHEATKKQRRREHPSTRS